MHDIPFYLLCMCVCNVCMRVVCVCEFNVCMIFMYVRYVCMSVCMLRMWLYTSVCAMHECDVCMYGLYVGYVYVV